MRNILYKWLRRSEQVTKTDMFYLAGGGYWLGLSQVIQLIASFVLALVFARVLPKEIYGNYQYIICLLYTSPSPRDRTRSRMPSSA